jgi:hypothetical protein
MSIDKVNTEKHILHTPYSDRCISWGRLAWSPIGWDLMVYRMFHGDPVKHFLRYIEYSFLKMKNDDDDEEHFK